MVNEALPDEPSRTHLSEYEEATAPWPPCARTSVSFGSADRGRANVTAMLADDVDHDQIDDFCEIEREMVAQTRADYAAHVAGLGLIRFGGHLSCEGYDVQTDA